MKLLSAFAVLVAGSAAVVVHKDETPAAARCAKQDENLEMDVKIRSWMPQPKDMSKTRFGSKYNPPAPSTSSNIMTGSFKGLPAFKSTYAFFKDACDGEDLLLMDNFVIEAGSTRVMQRTDTTSLESLTSGKDNGPISIELRDDSYKPILCCTFKLEAGNES